MSLWYPQAEVCSGAVADVLQCVVGGADGCIFSFGPRSLGKCWALVSGWASLGWGGLGGAQWDRVEVPGMVVMLAACRHGTYYDREGQLSAEPGCGALCHLLALSDA